MKHLNKPIIDLFTGDWHILSDTGLVLPGYPVKSKEGRPYNASPRQIWLYNCLQTVLAMATELSKYYYIYFHHGAETVDGVQHHGSTQTYGTTDDQVEMTAEIMRPFVKLAAESFALTGTESHSGPEGSSDRSVAREAGIPASNVADVWDMEIAGRRLSWSHHGIPVGKKAATVDNGMATLAVDTQLQCALDGTPKPDLIVAHHVHRSPDPVTRRGITVAVCGCFQLSTSYGVRFSPFKSVDVGVLWWRPDIHKVYNHVFAQVRQTRVVAPPYPYRADRQ